MKKTRVSERELTNTSEMKDPVPTIIYGRFSDEANDAYRIGLREKSEIENGVGSKGVWVPLSSGNSVFIPEKLVNVVSGKKIVLAGDTIELEEFT